MLWQTSTHHLPDTPTIARFAGSLFLRDCEVQRVENERYAGKVGYRMFDAKEMKPRPSTPLDGLWYGWIFPPGRKTIVYRSPALNTLGLRYFQGCTAPCQRVLHRTYHCAGLSLSTEKRTQNIYSRLQPSSEYDAFGIALPGLAREDQDFAAEHNIC